MKFHIATEKGKILVYLDATKIEVEDIVGPSEDDYVEEYDRTIRFTSHYGEAVEILCSSFDEKSLKLKHVKELKPVRKPKPKEDDWLTPKVYKGKPEKEDRS